MSDGVQARFQSSRRHREPRGQRRHRSFRGRSRVLDIRPAVALAVTGIIDQQKSVSGVLITARQREPIERQRAIATEEHPKPSRQDRPTRRRQVERRLPACRYLERKLHRATCGQQLVVVRAIRVRMVNEHMRETIEHSDKGQRRDQQDRDRSSQGACHTGMLSRSESLGHANRAAFRGRSGERGGS